MSKNLQLHCLFYVTMNIYFCFYFNIARDVVTVLPIFVNIYHFNYTLSHAHAEALTHKHTYMINTQEEWRRAWLKGAEERFYVKNKGLAHTQKKQSTNQYLKSKKDSIK